MFDIRPYDGAGAVTFGMSRDEVITALGQPKMVRKNRLKQTDMGYPECAVILSADEQRVVEIVFFPEAELFIKGIDIFNDPGAFQKLVDLDGNPFEYQGTVLLMKLGIATGDFRAAHNREEKGGITAFAHGQWDDLRNKFNRFPRPSEEPM